MSWAVRQAGVLVCAWYWGVQDDSLLVMSKEVTCGHVLQVQEGSRPNTCSLIARLGQMTECACNAGGEIDNVPPILEMASTIRNVTDNIAVLWIR